MRAAVWAVLVLLWCFPGSTAGAGSVADLAADWSNSSNPNTSSFGTWSYRQGSSLLSEVSNWNGAGSVGFTVPQPAWAPSDTSGDFLPAAFKALSVPTGPYDFQVGDVVVHTTDQANGDSNGPVNFLWTSPNAGTVTISGDVWAAATLAGRNNEWALLVNGVVVSSGTNIAAYDRANPFLFSDGSGGAAALTQHVIAGSAIELEIMKTTTYGYFVGANLTITEASIPEPGSLTLAGAAFAAIAAAGAARRIVLLFR